MLSMLNPGGVAALHYSVQRTLNPMKSIAYRLKHDVPLGRNFLNVVQGRAWSAPAMQMNNYPLADVIRTFDDSGMKDIVVVPEWHSAALTVRIFGRKSRAS